MTTDLVAAALRLADPDRYYASLIIHDATARSAIQSLYAFNAEVASVAERVKNPAAGEVRLQWWADALVGNGHGEVRQNPLAAALLDTVTAYRLPVKPLVDLIHARRFDLYADPMPDVSTFEGYAGETASILFQLAAMILKSGVPVESGDAAGHLGVAQAYFGHLAAFGSNASRGRIVLPWTVLTAAGVTEGEVFSGTISEGLLEGLAVIRDLAREHLDKATLAISVLPRPLRPAFAMIALLHSRARALERSAERPFAPQTELADWRKLAALWWWALRNG